MQYSSSILLLAFAATNVLAHGVVDTVTGANGVTMMGLTVVDGTPRDCSQNSCGSQADTAIIRARELGTDRASALGRTQGSGPVDPAKNVAIFMGGDANATDVKQARQIWAENMAKRGLARRQLGNLFGGGNGGGATAQGTPTPKGSKEVGVKAMTGAGSADGLPTASDDGSITMNFHQINQDGAGPLTATVDSTTGGSDPAAFKSAEVTQNVPGIAAGFSAATNMDFPVTIKMAQGTTCSGSVGGANNVCIARIQNATPAGPFGGAIAFTQSAAGRKRSIEYNLAKRRMARSAKLHKA